MVTGPLVSIILPTHNGVRFLRQSIESCLAQSYESLELVVVDDASTDDVSDTLAGLRDSRITLIRNEHNLGLPRSLNVGFARAAGTFLTWTSDDNYYGSTAIARLVDTLESRPDVGLVYGSFHLVDEQGNVIGRRDCPPPVYLPKDNTVGAYFLYRREVRDRIGDYDPGMRLAEDYDYWLRVHRHFRCCRVDAAEYYYRVHDASLTGTAGGQEIVRVARRAQRKNRWWKSWLICLFYSTADPVAGAVSNTRTGGVLKSVFGRRWRAIAGR